MNRFAILLMLPFVAAVVSAADRQSANVRIPNIWHSCGGQKAKRSDGRPRGNRATGHFHSSRMTLLASTSLLLIPALPGQDGGQR